MAWDPDFLINNSKNNIKKKSMDASVEPIKYSWFSLPLAENQEKMPLFCAGI